MKRIMNVMEAGSMFAEVWSFYKTYAGRQLNEQERGDVVGRSQELHKKYNADLCLMVTGAVVDELMLTEKFLKAREGNGSQK